MKSTGRLKSLLHQFPSPFTWGGAVLFGAAAVILGWGLAEGNPYDIVLAGLVLTVLSALALVGILAARLHAGIETRWVVPERPSAGDDGGEQLISCSSIRLPYFFRLHYEIRGTFDPARGTSLRVYTDGSTTRGEEIVLDLRFPLSGLFEGAGRCSVRDVFGLVRIPFGESQSRRIAVLPAASEGNHDLRIEALSGDEEKQSRRSSDDDRYFMREYAPGDRFRDINWKVSSRLAQLMTRISPLSQEKTRTLLIDFRNFGPLLPPMAALWALDRLRSRFILFLRRMRDEHPEFRFRIRTSGGIDTLETEQDFGEFVSRLPGLGFHHPSEAAQGSDPRDEFTRGEVFVFSTVFDSSLRSFLLSRNEEISNLFVAVVGRASSGEAEEFRLRSLFADGFLPRRLVLRDGGANRSSFPRPARGTLEILYTEVGP